MVLSPQTVPFLFQDVLPRMTSLTPLTGPNGQKFLGSLGLCSDILLDKMTQAVALRVPGQGDPSQIPYLADDRLLVQGPAESNASFIARLKSAFPDAKIWGSRFSILRELQAYAQNLQPGVVASYPEFAIVGATSDGVHSYAQWDTLYQGTALGAPPAKQVVSPSNFSWNGSTHPTWAFLVLYMSYVASGLSGTGAATASAGAGTLPGGQTVNGVWVPATSGTPVNNPWITLTGLSGLTSANAGMWLACSGWGNVGNDGLFAITQVLSSTSCIVANPRGVTADTGNWSVVYYPWIGPSMPWGAANSPAFGSGTFGLNVSSNVMQSIRQILQKRKSAATYYPHIIVCFDGFNGAAGNAYSPSSTQGSGNPDGTFGPPGKTVNGVWVPSRLINFTTDCYCQGTGSYSNCAIENVT